MDENGSIESLTLEINARSESAEKAVDKLISTLERLQNKTAHLGLGNIGTQLNGIRRAAAGFGDKEDAGLERILGALDRLQNVSTIKLSSSIANQLGNIATAAGNINGTDFSGIERLSKALSGLAGVGQVNISSALNQLNRIPKIAESLNTADIDKFAAKIRQVTDALKPLAEQMEKVSKGFSAFPDKLQRVLKETEKIPSANRKAANSYALLATKVGAAALAIQRILRTALSRVDLANEQIETTNLFNVAMGQYAAEAREYANAVGDAFGIDPVEWMKNQGVLMTLATGFGVAGDKAADMSKNLTQLAYDLSSFYNMSTEDAFQKIQSGLAGEIEPMRRLGYDLSNAALQQIAYANGIDKTVSSMTQAEKAALRYYAMMNQVTQVHGDLARTIDSPANQLRRLKTAVTEAARAIGNLLVPVLQVVVPWLIAAANAVTDFANSLALLLGIQNVDDTVNFETIVGGAENAGAALDGATESAAKFRKMLLGIDELNVLNEDTGTASGVGTGTGALGDLANQIDGWNDLMGQLEDVEINPLALTIKDVVFDWSDMTAEDLLQKLIVGMGAILGGAAGLALGGFKGGLLGLALGTALTLLLASMIFDHDGKISGTELIQSLLPILGGIGGLILTGSPVGGLIGFAIGAALSLLLEHLGFKEGTDDFSSPVWKDITDIIARAFAGAGIGFILGGPGGAAIGAAIGTVVSLVLNALGWNGNESESVDLLQSLLPILMGAGGAAIGFAIGGPGGAALGAAIGVGLGFIVKSVDWEQVQEKITALVDWIEEKFSQAKTLVSIIFGDMGDSVEPEFKTPAMGTVGSFIQNFISAISGLGKDTGSAMSEAASAVGSSFVDPATAKLNEFSDIVSKTALQNVDTLTESFTLAGSSALEHYTVPVTEGLTQLSATIEEQSAANTEVLTNSFAGAGTAVTEQFITPTQESLTGFFTWLDEMTLQNNAKLSENMTLASTGIQELFIVPTQENMNLMFAAMKEGFTLNSQMIVNSFTEAAAQVNEGYIQNLNQQFETMFANQKAKWTENKTHIVSSFQQARTGVQTGFITPTTNQMQNMSNTLRNIFKSLQNAIISAFQQAAAGARNAFSGLASWFNSNVYTPIANKLSQLSSRISTVVSQANSAAAQVAALRVSGYASGGFPSVGEMFIARENGPELVGRIGNQSAVANNNQIIAGIKQGVYEAMMASGGGGSSGDIKLYISGKQVMTAVAQEARRETIRTGVNPLTQGG